MASKQAPSRLTPRPAVRTHRYSFSLNDQEEKALQRYCAKYRVNNKSKFIREVLITAILHRFEEDHPTLF